jgi:hypothetical protein
MILGMIWAMFLRFQAVQLAELTGGSTESAHKDHSVAAINEEMLRWVEKTKADGFEELTARNFKSSTYFSDFKISFFFFCSFPPVGVTENSSPH